MSERVREEEIRNAARNYVTQYADAGRPCGEAERLTTVTDREALIRIGAALAARPASDALAMDVLRCIPADWKPGYGREWGNLGPILAEFIDDLREGRYAARPASAEPVAWQWRFKGADYPSYCEDRKVAEVIMADGLEVIPLYTTPPAAAQDRERLEPHIMSDREIGNAIDEAMAERSAHPFNVLTADGRVFGTYTKASAEWWAKSEDAVHPENGPHRVAPANAMHAAHAAGATDGK